MSNFVRSQTAQIQSGQTVSSPVAVANSALTGLFIPALNSNSFQTLRAEVAPDIAATSAQFVPLMLADRTGQWGITSTTGLLALPLSVDFHCFEAMRFVVSSAQIAPRDLVIVARQL